MSAILIPNNVQPVRGAPSRPVPPLENGDRLTHDEFMKRYDAMPPHVKAERIEGIVYMAAAALSAEFHGEQHIDLSTWLGTYRASTPGVAVADNSTILLDLDNDPQPDICAYIRPSHGGNVKFNAKGYIVGAPEFVAEIAASSVSYDLGIKLNAYRRNGVKEYLVHRTYDGEIDWFVLRDGKYEKSKPDAEGIYRSEVFPGLWLAEKALIERRLTDVLAILQRGMSGNEHVEFVKKLATGR